VAFCPWESAVVAAVLAVSVDLQLAVPSDSVVAPVVGPAAAVVADAVVDFVDAAEPAAELVAGPVVGPAVVVVLADSAGIVVARQRSAYSA